MIKLNLVCQKNIMVESSVLKFCRWCTSQLYIEQYDGRNRFKCSVCPYFYNITKTIRIRTYPKHKDVDLVLNSAEAWSNADSTEETCPVCSYRRAYFLQIQTRSADEPMTIFYRCCNESCKHRWRD